MSLSARLLAAAAAAYACALAGSAVAQTSAPHIYGSAGYGQKDDSDLGAVQLRLGTRFGAYFGVEGEYGFGVKSDKVDIAVSPPGYIKRELRHELAAYAVGYLPLSPQADLYARVGYGSTWFKSATDLTPDRSRITYKDDATSLNLGVGGQYFFDASNGVRVDYVRQDYKGAPTDDVWSIAYTRRF